MKNSKRALRRHHDKRVRNRYIQRLHKQGYSIKEIHDTINVDRVYNNPTVCSCSMCCNERRNPWNTKRERLTIQERKAEDVFKEEI